MRNGVGAPAVDAGRTGEVTVAEARPLPMREKDILHREYREEPALHAKHGNLGIQAECRARQDAEAASAELRDRTLRLFRKWEWKHGFQEGAGMLLVPAGWRP